MGLSKQQVEQHIANTEKRFKSEKELKQHGYEFAKLCYQVKKYDDAIRYLKGYLSLNDTDHRAHKWMGRLYVATDDLSKALFHYKTSLKLKGKQRDVIISVAELFCKIDNPPLEEVKESLSQLVQINQHHPLVLALSEKVQSLKGSLSGTVVEDLISKQLVLCSSDVRLHIRLVELHASSGTCNLQKAFDYCNMISEKGLFVSSLEWQQCALNVAERYCEEVQVGGGERKLESLIAVLEGISLNFGLQVNVSSLPHCAALLLKYDKILFVALKTLQFISAGVLTVHRIALRELTGNLHYLVSQYLYLLAQTSGRNENFQLGHLCLLASIRASPPDVGGVWFKGHSAKVAAEKWHTSACARLSVIGRHLMVLASVRGVDYLKNLPKLMSKERSFSMSLVKTLFTGNPNLSGVSIHFGTKTMSFSLQESFLAADDSVLDCYVNLPTDEDMHRCDEVFISNCGRDLRGLVWLSLVYKAADLSHDVGEWPGLIFKGLKLDTPDLARSDAESLSLCDIEAFFVLLVESKAQLISLFSSGRDKSLSAALSTTLPCSVAIKERKLEFWKAVHQHIGADMSASEASSVKALIQEELCVVRGCRPLQLDLTELTLLARHFKARAESVAEQGGGDGLSYKSVVSVLLKWSSHYWSIITELISGGKKMSGKRKNVSLNFDVESEVSDSLLAEAQMSLANAALYKHDTSKALKLYSQVKTPQAAWNQSQIYWLLAEKGELDTPKDVHMRITNLTKALDTITIAMARLSDDDDPTLRDKLLKQQIELKQLLKDAKDSPVACMLQYDDSPPVPHRSSTPAKPSVSSKSDVLSAMRYGEKPSEQEKLLLSMSEQLKHLQEELEEIKSLKSPRLSPAHEAKVSDKVTPKQTSSSQGVGSGTKLPKSPLAQGLGASPYQSDGLSTTSGLGGQQFISTFQQPSGAMQLPSATGNLFPSSGLLPVTSLPSSTLGGMSSSNADASSRQALTRSYVFGIPSTVANTFQFTPSSTLLSTVPVSAGSTASPFQFSASSTLSLGSQPPSTAGMPSSLGQSVPSLGSLQPATSGQVGAQGISTLPKVNIFGASASANASSSSIKPLSLSTGAGVASVSPAKSPIFSSIGRSMPTTSTVSPILPGTSTSTVAPVPSTGVFNRLPRFSIVGLGGSSLPLSAATSTISSFPPVSTSTIGPTPSGTYAPPSLPSGLVQPFASTSKVHTSPLGVSTNTVGPLPSFAPTSTVGPLPSFVPPSTVGPLPSFVPPSTVGPLPSFAPTSTVGPLPSFAPTSTVGPLPSFAPTSTVGPLPSFAPTSTVGPLPSFAPPSTVGPLPSFAPTSTVGPLPSFVPPSTVGPLPSFAPPSTVGPLPSFAPPSTVGPLPSFAPPSTVGPLPSFVPPSTVGPLPSFAPTSTVGPLPSFAPPSTVGPLPSFVPPSTVGPLPSFAPTSTAGPLPSFAPTSTVGPLPSFAPTSKVGPPLSFAATNKVGAVPSFAPTSTVGPVLSFAPTSTISHVPYFASTSSVAPTATGISTSLSTGSGGASTFQFGSPLSFSITKPVAPTVSQSTTSFPTQSGLNLGSIPQPSTVLFKLPSQLDKANKQASTSIGSTSVTQASQSQSGFVLGSSAQPQLFSSTVPFRLSPQSKPATAVAQTDTSVPSIATKASPLNTQMQPFMLKSTSLQETAESRSTVFSPTLASLLSTTTSTVAPPSSVGSPGPSLPLTVHSTPKNETETDAGDDSFTVSSPHFEPLVSLPLVDEIKSGEEDEEVLFSHRAKLYRFHGSQWKERGLGDMKILKHKLTGKIRLLMRRDQVLKLCCNHYITDTMSLTEMKGLTQLAWCTNCDYSEGVPKPEKFTVKFKHEDTGERFKAVFEKCVRDLSNELSLSVSGDVTDVSGLSSADNSIVVTREEGPLLNKLSLPSASSGWTCDTCLVINKPSHVKCIACGTANTDKKSLTQGWVCSTCYVRNDDSHVQCMACEAARPINEESSSLKTAQTQAKDEDPLKGTFPPGSWTCGACSATNFPSMDKCIKCSSPKPAKSDSKEVDEAPISITTLFKFGQQAAPSIDPLSGFKFGSTLLKAPGIHSEPDKDGGIKIPGLSLPAHKSLVSESSQSMARDDLDSSLEREPDVYFTPVVSLPERVDTRTGEETDDVLFSERAKLFRFDNKTNNWKERGVGNIKVLKNKINGKSRLLMRREQVLKICCHHYITPETTLIPMQSSIKSWTWYTSCDFSDGESQAEMFAVRFKHQDSADKFKEKVDQCVSECDDSQPSIDEQEDSTEDYSSAAHIDDEEARDTEQQTGPLIEQQVERTCDTDDDVIYIKVEMPSEDKIELARRFMLPDTFFNYEAKSPCPGCRGCVDQIDGRYPPSEGQTSVTPSDVVERFESPKEKIKTSTSHDVFGARSTFISDKPILSFADLASSQSTGSPFSLGSSMGQSPHSFKGAGRALFSVKHEEEEDPEAEADVHFKALVSLPEIDVKTGEEHEEVLFTHRAKLFRFDENTNQWKERGIGDIKLLKNVQTNKTRVLMRRDQILKICCNHFITSDMTLLPHQEKSRMWCTLNDFADETPRPEKFAVKFKNTEIAQNFQTVFERCVSECKSDKSRAVHKEKVREVQVSKVVSLQEKFAPKASNWSCTDCLVSNPESAASCMACQATKPREESAQISTVEGVLENLHACSPDKVEANHTSQTFQLPSAVTPPTSTSVETTTTLSSSPKATPDRDTTTTPSSINAEEKVTFSAEGTLYNEDSISKQWRERGSGVMKIIENKRSGKKRLLMTAGEGKSVVFVVCAHDITPMMHLRARVDKDNAWVWNGLDSTSSTPTVRRYCLEFASDNDAVEFKTNFGVSFSLPSPSGQLLASGKDAASDDSGSEGHSDSEDSSDDIITAHSDKSQSSEIAYDTSVDDDDVMFLYEELPESELVRKAEELLLPKSFYLYENKPPCSGCRGCVDGEETISVSAAKPAASEKQVFEESATTTIKSGDERDKHSDREFDATGFSSAGMLSFADLISKQSDSFPSFSKKHSGFQFEGTGKQLFFSHASNDAEDDPEAEADIEFQPIVSLPKTYSVKSWDEDAKTLFSCRAKLFRFDGSTKQWKERGVGDMKIVQHRQNKKIRLIMRRDKIFKLCCNHYLTEDMRLEQLQTDRSWMWFTPSDFSDDTPQEEKLAVRFKHDEQGLEFKKVFDECAAKQKLFSKQPSPKVETTTKITEIFKQDDQSWECDVCLIRNKREDSKCVACGSPSVMKSTTGQAGGDTAAAIEPRDDDDVVSSQKSPSSSHQLSSEGTVSEGIKIPLLQTSPLTAFKQSLPPFGSERSNADISTLQTGGSSTGGMKIPLLQSFSLNAPRTADIGYSHSVDTSTLTFTKLKSGSIEKDSLSVDSHAVEGESTSSRKIDIPTQSAESTISGGIKLPLLQSSHLTDFKPPITSSSEVIITHSPSASDSSTGGIKIQQLLSKKPSSDTATTTITEMLKQDNQSWECDVCLVRNKREDSKCVACGSQSVVKGTTGQADGNTAAAVKSRDDDEVVSSQESPSSSHQLSSESTASEGIKIPLLQSSPLTAFKQPLPSFGSGRFSTDTSFLQSGGSSIGGIKIPLLQTFSLSAPRTAVASTQLPFDEESSEADQTAGACTTSSDKEVLDIPEPQDLTLSLSTTQQKSDEMSQSANDKATNDEDSSDAETADRSQQDATEVVPFSKHPQSIETILGGEISVPPQQHSTQTTSTATQSETHEECSETSPIVDSSTADTDKALSGEVVDIFPQQDPTVATIEQIPPSTLPQSTEESSEINRDASSSMIDDKFSVREVNVPPQDSPAADQELVLQDQLRD